MRIDLPLNQRDERFLHPRPDLSEAKDLDVSVVQRIDQQSMANGKVIDEHMQQVAIRLDL
jgi:hypothetical protein